MKISEYIEQLKKIKDDHGDLEVETSFFGRRESASEPTVAHRKIRTSRERKSAFWHKSDGPSSMGIMVVRL